MMITINNLYSVKNGGDLSPSQCQEINKLLSKITIDDIPEDQHDNVEDYLVNALNLNSVQYNLISQIEYLLSKLQN